MPRLSPRHGVVVDESDDGNAGGNGNHPAQEHPHQINVRTEFVPHIEKNARLNAVAEYHQNRRAAQWDSGENYKREGDEPLLHEPPAFWQLVAAPETFHPGTHYS